MINENKGFKAAVSLMWMGAIVMIIYSNYLSIKVNKKELEKV